MNNEKAIVALNALVEINNDRIKGYQTASKETVESDLKTLFAGFINTSQHCKQELVAEVTSLGGTATEGTSTSGSIFRVWMDIKASLTNKDRAAILNSCEYGEDAALETYDNALKNELENISPQQQTLINAQRILIKADHDSVKELRDSLVEQD